MKFLPARGIATSRLGRVVVVPLLFVASVACGPSVLVDPLIGDDPEILRHVPTSVPDLRQHAPTQSARALYLALVQDDAEVAFSLMSGETRAVLDTAAGAGVGSGVALIRAGAIPMAGPGARVVSVPPLQWILLPDIAYFTLTLDPVVKPRDAGDAVGSETVVYAIDATDHFREVVLVREPEGWRVHFPVLTLVDDRSQPVGGRSVAP